MFLLVSSHFFSLFSHPPFALFRFYTLYGIFIGYTPGFHYHTCDNNELHPQGYSDIAFLHFGKELPNHQLHTVAARCGYHLAHHHHALADAEACAQIALLILPEVKE